MYNFSGENLDAYLGDYPILDYARVKLDPECDLRILTQTFGEDGYGIGLPKGSPLKVLYSGAHFENINECPLNDLMKKKNVKTLPHF